MARSEQCLFADAKYNYLRIFYSLVQKMNGSCHGMTLHLDIMINVEPRHGVAHDHQV
jgi:hypothetical protein